MSVSRRTFVITSLAAGASLLLRVDGRAQESDSFQPGPFLEIRPDGTVIVLVTRQEMGQGVRTSLPMLIAEELDADWSGIAIRQAPLDPKYGEQRTGGSLSIRELWDPLRRAGATARAMLLAAASAEWGVPLSDLRTGNGTVFERNGTRSAGYGRFAGRAAALPVPVDVPLKTPEQFRIIGTSQPRLDGMDIVTGRARYGIDARLPGMLHATFVRCPVIGGKLRSFDDAAARSMPGVKGVIPIDGTTISPALQWANGVAVVAQSTAIALRAREALTVEWDLGPNSSLHQGAIEAAMRLAAEKRGTVVRREGDPEEAFAAAATIVEADYEVPYLSHSPLETLNCIVSVEKDRCTVIAPTQLPAGARRIASLVTGLPPEKVSVEITLIGGGFGRRLAADFVGEAALISRAAGAPIQLLWTREDDTRHGFYRPASHHRMRAAMSDGKITAWTHRISGPSRQAVRGPNVERPEESETYAAIELPYAVPSLSVDYNHVYVPLPCGPWRGVAYSQTGFVIESFIDELAHAAGSDPVSFRLAHLRPEAFLDHDGESLIDPARMKRVLELAVRQAGKVRKGSGRGVAVTFDHGSAVAHVADVSVDGRGQVKVGRFVSAIDCGLAVHPGHVRAQMEGGIGFALSAALRGEITVREGRVEQGSYADYPVLRMSEMPPVEVHIVPSREAPGGVGEPPIAGVAPAVTNAIFAATGIRVRRLPISRSLNSAKTTGGRRSS